MAYFPFSLETFQPSFCTIMLNGTILIHKFIVSADLIVDGFMIPICEKHNILVTKSLVMKIEIPYTTNSIYSMLNQTIDYRSSLTKCQMGINFKVVKLESPIVQAQLHFS